MSQSHSAQIARSSDHDRWLCALFAEPEAREAIFSLLAFNAEIARIRETVSESILGDIRLKWWMETLERLPGDAPGANPVAVNLAQTIRDYDLPVPLFMDMLRGRSLDLNDTPPASMADLVHYADLTGGALHALIARVLAGDMIQGRALGAVWALVGILRAIPFHYSHGLVLLPEDLLSREGLSKSTFLKPANRANLTRVIAQLARLIESRLSDVSGAKNLKPAEKSMHILASMYMKKLRRRGYDIYGMDWEIPGWRRAGRLWIGSLTGR